MAKHKLTDSALTITVKYTAGQPPVPDHEPAVIAGGGNLTFTCQDATLIIVCQYNKKGKSSQDHCPFATAGSVFKVPKGKSATLEVKNYNAALSDYKYTIVAVPDNGTDTQSADPTIIIKQNLS